MARILCPVCGFWQSEAETDPEERARINAAFAGRKSGQLANAVEECGRLREALDAIRRDDFNRTIHPSAAALADYVLKP